MIPRNFWFPDLHEHMGQTRVGGPPLRGSRDPDEWIRYTVTRRLRYVLTTYQPLPGHSESCSVDSPFLLVLGAGAVSFPSKLTTDNSQHYCERMQLSWIGASKGVPDKDFIDHLFRVEPKSLAVCLQQSVVQLESSCVSFLTKSS